MTAIDSLALTRPQMDLIPIEELTNNIKNIHTYEMDIIFRDELSKVSDDDIILAKFFRLLSLAFSFHLSRVVQPLSFEPSMIIGDKRTFLPEDFTSEALLTLKIALERITNPFIASRLNEIIWINDRKEKVYAINAIESYALMCEEVVHSIYYDDGVYSKSDIIFLNDYMERGLNLSGIVYGRKSEGNEKIKIELEKLYLFLIDRGVFEGFDSVTNLMFSNFKNYNVLQLARNAEKIADSHTATTYFEAVKKLYYTASWFYKRANCVEDSKRCLISAAMLTVKVKDSSDDPGFKAAWLRTAIQELKNIGGMNELISQLTDELSKVRVKALDHLAPISIPLDIKDSREENYDRLVNLTLSDIIIAVIKNLPLENIDKIREDAIAHSKKFVFSSMLSTEHVDEKGRKVAVSDGISSDGCFKDNAAIMHRIKFIDIDHQFYVHTIFEVARQIIGEKHHLTLDTFGILINYTPFVPNSLKGVFCLGFYRLFQGDFIGACYLLLPNMESAIRHVYELSGKDPTRVLERELEEATSLTILLSKARQDLEEIFSEDIILTIDMMFLQKVGPSLRHRVAHGNLSTNACYDSAAIYSCCLMLYLCCVPLLGKWDDLMDDQLRPKLYD
jgi:hypothetical protein